MKIFKKLFCEHQYQLLAHYKIMKYNAVHHEDVVKEEQWYYFCPKCGKVRFISTKDYR